MFLYVFSIHHWKAFELIIAYRFSNVVGDIAKRFGACISPFIACRATCILWRPLCWTGSAPVSFLLHLGLLSHLSAESKDPLAPRLPREY